MSGRVETVPPPPPVDARLFRWLTDVRAALGVEPVRELALANGWQPHPAYGAPGYFRRGGLVHLTGAVQGGAAGTAIATLPVGFRPAGRLRFEGAGIEVGADGAVVPDGLGGNGRISLDGTVFRAGG